MLVLLLSIEETPSRKKMDVITYPTLNFSQTMPVKEVAPGYYDLEEHSFSYTFVDVLMFSTYNLQEKKI